MIRVSIACDICKKTDLHVYETNLPVNGKVDSPPAVNGLIWWIVLRPGDDRSREIHWHFCSERCFIVWTEHQAASRKPAKPLGPGPA